MKMECPRCHQKYEFADEQRGQMFACLECGADFIIADAKTPAAPKTTPGVARRNTGKWLLLFCGGILLAAGICVAVILLFSRNVEMSVPTTAKSPSDLQHENFLNAMKDVDAADALNLSRIIATPGFDIDYEDKNGETLLRACVRKGNRELIQILISGGVSLNRENKNGEVALWEAVRKNDLSTGTFLAGKGAHLNGGSSDTALGIAAERGYSEMVAYLVDSNALFLECKGIRKAIFRAIENNHVSCVKALMKKYFIEETDENGNTILLAAIAAGNADITRLALEKSADGNARNRNGESACFIALKGNYEKLANLFDPDKLDLNQSNQEGVTLPMLCARNGNLPLLQKYLTDQNKNLMDQKGRNVLSYACLGKDPKIVPYLLKNGVSANGKDFSTSPLYAALKAGNQSAVTALLDAGAVWTGKDAAGNDALMVAAGSGKPELVRTLLMKKFNLFATNAEGKTARDIAMASGFREVEQILTPEMNREVLERIQRETDAVIADTDSSHASLSKRLDELEAQTGKLPEAEKMIATVRKKIDQRERAKQTTQMNQALAKIKNDTDLTTAIKILEAAIREFPMANNLNTAQSLMEGLTRKQKAEEVRQEEIRKKKEKLKGMSSEQIQAEVKAFIDDWMGQMRIKNDTSKFWKHPSLASVLFDVKSWEVIGVRSEWSPLYNSVSIMVESSTKGGYPIRKTWSAVLSRNDDMQWKILSLDE